MTWRPTSSEDLFKVEYLASDGATWKPCMFTNLRKGTVCRFYSCDGVPIHPLTHEVVEAGQPHVAGVCMADPMKNRDFDGRGEVGYAIAIEIVPEKAAAN